LACSQYFIAFVPPAIELAAHAQWSETLIDNASLRRSARLHCGRKLAFDDDLCQDYRASMCRHVLLTHKLHAASD
jgi:hypothetical protein